MGYIITSRFMQREGFRSRGHSGIDFAMDSGTPLKSIQDGQISKIIDYGSQNAGKTILIRWNDGKTAVYGHLSKFGKFKEGDTVHTGDVIGYSGNSGHVVGSNGGYHLHFGLKDSSGHFVDPSPYIANIQNMNNPINIVQQTAEIKLNFFNYMQQHMDMLGGMMSNLKVNLIDSVFSTDYSPLVQLVKNLVQLLFIHI